MSGLLVFGRHGQLARELARLAPDGVFLDRAAVDLADADACRRAITDHRPAAVINAAAWTAVDDAEAHEDEALKINGTAPGAMAAAAKRLGIPLVHVSTDYVFQGGGTRPWTPDDAPRPLGAYGRTKLAGEEAIRAVGGNFAILRTSWVFSAHGHNFVRTMLRLGAAREELAVVDDQTGGPTPAADLARACLTMAQSLVRDPGVRGTYHLSGAPDVTWAGFAREIMAEAGLGARIRGVPSSAWPSPAPRPVNSRLDCTRTRAVFGIPRPDWRHGLRAVLDDLATETADD